MPRGKKIHNRLGTTTKPSPNRFSVPHKRDENQALRTCTCGKDVTLISSIDNDLDDVKEVLCFECHAKKNFKWYEDHNIIHKFYKHSPNVIIWALELS